MVVISEEIVQEEIQPESSYIVRYKRAVTISFRYSQVSFWR